MNLLACSLAAALLVAPSEPSLYGISTGHSPNKLGELVTIDARDGTTKVVGSFSNHAGYTVPNDIVRSADGKHYYLTELEIGEGWAKTHLMTVDAKSLEVERSVLLGEAFDALVVDVKGALLAGSYDKEGSALVRIDPATGESTLIGRPGRDFQFMSFSLDAHSGKLLGLTPLLRTSKYALVWVDPATGKTDSSVELALEATPYAMALAGDGKARIVGEQNTLYEADPSTGRTRKLASTGAAVVVGLHAQK
ncbi:MAG: hypothetical protein IPJ19_07285 [Planctomycetes bacterium]|nr:hypothetical protein [Planctomycetota bacterium]